MLQFAINITPPEIPSAGFITAGIIVGFYGGIIAAVFAARAALRFWYKKVIGLKKTIFLVSVPKEAAEKKSELEKQKTLQEIQEEIGAGEKLFAAIGGLHAQRGIVHWFLGRTDLFSFEIVVKEGLIWFYIATPGKYTQYVRDQGHAMY